MSDNQETSSYEGEREVPRVQREPNAAGGGSISEQRVGGPSGGGPKRRFQSRRKICRFCKNHLPMNYCDPEGLKRFVTDRGKILPRRITGTCAKHQRGLVLTIKRARILAFLCFLGR